MERHPVVDAGLRQPQELTDMRRRLVGQNLNRDGPALVSSTAR